MKSICDTSLEMGRLEVVDAPPDPQRILDVAYECWRCRVNAERWRDRSVDVYIGKSAFRAVLDSFSVFMMEKHGLAPMAPMVTLEALLSPYVAINLDPIGLRLVEIPAGPRTTISIVDFSDVLPGGDIMTPGRHYVWELRNFRAPKDPVDMLVATHTGKRIPRRGQCEKCGTQTNWVVDASGRVGAYWCGCGN